MNIAKVHTRALLGVETKSVCIETHISNGLPSFQMVGLAETAVKESKERVRSALLTSQFEFPAKRITINLSPADLPKSGSGFDLAIAISILCASKQISHDKLAELEFAGELALNGELKSSQQLLPAIIAAIDHDKVIIVPKSPLLNAHFIDPKHVLVASHLIEVCQFLENKGQLAHTHTKKTTYSSKSTKDWSDIKGQAHAKRALEIAASGGHHSLLFGPPGCGKTMLASRFNTIMPSLSKQQQRELAIINAYQRNALTISERPPFRNPHHSASLVAIVGGGNPIAPGEISYAHHGILFLDELPEFNRTVIESLREPLEAGEITIVRANNALRFPCSFQLIAALNPCPCGYFNCRDKECQCSPVEIKRYQNKLSNPLLDRIDLYIDVPLLPIDEITKKSPTESSHVVLERVKKTQKKQTHRQKMLNCGLSNKQLYDIANLTDNAVALLNTASDKLKLSTRSYFKTLKVARTIADMAPDRHIQSEHISEALSYRQK